MPPREVDEVSIRLGEVSARLKAIEDIAGSERETARQHRVDLKIVIDAFSASLREMASREGNFHDRLAKAEELTHDYRQQRDMARGAAKMVNFVRASVIFFATMIATALAYFGMHGAGKP